MTTMTITTTDLLTDDMLARFDERAATYDRENRFFDEDWDELAPVRLPARRRADRVRRRRASASTTYAKLARAASPTYAPATALAVNMHCYWTGVAADLLRAGDDSCRWMLEKAADGEVFARSTVRPATTSRCCCRRRRPRRVDGGWEITGHKIFGSLSPVWTLRRLPRHGHVRPGQPEDRPRLPARDSRRATRSSRRGTPSACGPRRARTRCSIGRSCPTSTSCSSARPVSPEPACSRWRSSPGH